MDKDHAGRVLVVISVHLIISHSKMVWYSQRIPITGITVYKVNIVHSIRIRLGEMLPGDKKKKRTRKVYDV